MTDELFLPLKLIVSLFYILKNQWESTHDSKRIGFGIFNLIIKTEILLLYSSVFSSHSSHKSTAIALPLGQDQQLTTNQATVGYA